MGQETVLITGGGGFLGGNLAAAFSQAGYQVLAAVRPNSDLRRIGNLVNAGKAGLVLAEEPVLRRVFFQHRIDAIIHTATNYGRHGESVAEIAAANTDLPISILELAKSAGCKYFVNSDTFLPQTLPKDDKYYQYVQTKKEFLRRSKKILESSKIKFINARIYQMYGPNDNPDKFLPWIIKTLLSNQPSIALSPGKQARDFIYISDVVAAFAQVLKFAADFGDFEDFEIGTGKATDFKSVVESLKILTASESRLLWGERGYEPGEIMNSRAPVENNRQIFWQARTDLKEGLRLTAEYYKQNQVL